MLKGQLMSVLTERAVTEIEGNGESRLANHIETA